MLKHWSMIASMALLVCTAPSYGQNPSDKSVQVMVVNGVISVSPDPLSMGKNGQKISWVLVTPGFSFPDNGIVIKGANGEYGDCRNEGNEFVCKKLKHMKGKQYKYDVNLRSSSGQALFLDPIINNE